MSIKINRYPALEGGNWSLNGRNVMTIKVPDVGFADLHNSYVCFRVQPTVTNTNGDVVIYPMVFADPTVGVVGATNLNYTLTSGQALIRNARVQYEKARIPNERIDQNVYHQNMDWYCNNRANQRCSTMLTGSNSRNYGRIGLSGLPDSPFIQYSRPSQLVGSPGAVADKYSQMRNPDILIPLKHIDQLADGARQFPMVAFGETLYTVQLENVFNVVAPAQMPAVIFHNITVGVGNPPLGAPVAVNPSLGSATCPLFLAETYETERRLNDIPVYVGASMNFTYQIDMAAVVVAQVIISKISMLAGGNVACEFATPIPIVAGAGAAINVTLRYLGYEATVPAGVQSAGYPSPVALPNTGYGVSALWEITNAWVELHELKLNADQQKLALSAMKSMELPFLECRTIRKNMLQTTTEYSDAVPYDVGCIGLVLMTPQPNTMTSGFDLAYQYRFKVNSKDPLGRWIIVGPEHETSTVLPVGRQLHNYQLESMFETLGKTLKKYDAPSLNYQSYQDQNTHAVFPLEIKDNMQNGVVSINLATNATMQQKTCYWQFLYQRAVQIKNGRVVAVL